MDEDVAIIKIERIKRVKEVSRYPRNPLCRRPLSNPSRMPCTRSSPNIRFSSMGIALMAGCRAISLIRYCRSTVPSDNIPLPLVNQTHGLKCT